MPRILQETLCIIDSVDVSYSSSYISNFCKQVTLGMFVIWKLAWHFLDSNYLSDGHLELKPTVETIFQCVVV